MGVRQVIVVVVLSSDMNLCFLYLLRIRWNFLLPRWEVEAVLETQSEKGV